MTLGLDQKEDLRLRMMELEKKLAESEEERNKLEKTCNILMRAFREEEKMHYRELNKKYEKFLEDCNLRKRRNDIILKSLCRIEDRARALLAKTERLKILKDRYISYLKINDFKKVEPILSWKNFQYVSPSQKITHDVTPKTVHWKSTYISDVMLGHKTKEFIEPQGSLSYKSNSTNEISLKNISKADSFENNFTFRRILEYEKLEKDSLKHQNLGDESFSENLNASYSQENSGKSFKNNKAQEVLMNFESTSLNRENKCDDINYSPIAQSANLKKDVTFPEVIEREIRLVENLNNQPEEESFDVVRREEVTVRHQESIEKLKKALSVEKDDEIETDKKSKIIGETQKIIEKDEIEMNEKTFAQKNNANGPNEEPNRFVIFKTDNDIYNKSKDDAIGLLSDHFNENDEYKVAKNLPVGLDGVDYQNETYPESYYEQPVHQNHTSIASDVILEEDEWEQDTDQDGSDKKAKNESYFIKDSCQNTSQSSEPCPDKQLLIFPDKSSESNEEAQKFINQEKNFKMDDTGFDKKDQSNKSDDVLNSEKNNKRTLQSNLMHLLESDSESFQIEHGDLATGNEDSDFDFSFNQN